MLLPGQVQAGGQLRAQRRVAAAVGVDLQIAAAGAGAAGDHLRQRRRLVAAGQAGADQAAAAFLQPVDRMQHRRGDPAAVDRLGLAGDAGAAAGVDALMAQAGLDGPLRRGRPFVLDPQRGAAAARLQRVAEVAVEHAGAAVGFGLQRAAALVAATALQLPAQREQMAAFHQRPAGLAAGAQPAVAAVALLVDAAQRAAGGIGLGAPAAAVRARAGGAGAQLQPQAVRQPGLPLRVEPRQREAALAGGGRLGVVGAAGAGEQRAAAFADTLGAQQEGHQREALARAQPPLHPPAGMQRAAPRAAVVHPVLVARELAVGLRGLDGAQQAAVIAAALAQMHREVVGQILDLLGAGPAQARLPLPVVAAQAQVQIVQALAHILAQHDVDGAGHRLRAGLGGRAAGDLDALDLARGERVQAHAHRHALAVDQDLGVAAAQAAQARIAAAPGAAVERHAGLALEHLGHGGVALAFQLLAADDGLGGGGLAALAALVGPAGTDLDPLQRGLRRRHRCGRRAALLRLDLRGGQRGDRGQRQQQAHASLAWGLRPGGRSSVPGDLLRSVHTWRGRFFGHGVHCLPRCSPV